MIKYDRVSILLNDGVTEDRLSFLIYCYETHQAPSNSSLQDYYKHIEKREWISNIIFESDYCSGANLKDFLILVAKVMEEIDEISNAGDLYLPALKELRTWIKENAE